MVERQGPMAGRASSSSTPDETPAGAVPSQWPVYGGRYAVEAELGRGGMGRVLRARDLKLGRAIALKVLVPGKHDEQQQVRFEQEARAAGALDHPNIVAVHDVGGHGDEAYIVTELLEGETLRLVMKNGPLAPEKVLDLGTQLADGLAAAHRKGIIHRDLKPENLFLTEEGRLKILDFGIAKLRDAKKDLTGETVLGTPYYMSPEQATGYAIDARSDIYSLGITAFHLLTGRKPFEAKNKVDVMLMQVKAPLPDLTQIVPCDVRIAAIVGKMCAKKPAERYQSCDDLIAAIDSLPRSIGGGQPDAAAQAEKTRLLSPPPRGVSPAARRSRPSPPAKSSPWLGVAAGATAAVLVLAAAAIGWMRFGTASRGRVPAAGWVAQGGLRKVQSAGGYGNCVFFRSDPAEVTAVLSAADSIHARCYFAQPVGDNRTGEIWEELFVDGRKRAHVIFDPALTPNDDQLTLPLSERHAARLRELSSGQHTVDVWIYRRVDDAHNPVPLAAGELVVRK